MFARRTEARSPEISLHLKEACLGLLIRQELEASKEVYVTWKKLGRGTSLENRPNSVAELPVADEAMCIRGVLRGQEDTAAVCVLNC